MLRQKIVPFLRNPVKFYKYRVFLRLIYRFGESPRSSHAIDQMFSRVQRTQWNFRRDSTERTIFYVINFHKKPIDENSQNEILNRMQIHLE